MLLDLACRPAHECIDDECIVHVDEDADGGIHPRKLFDREHRVKEAGPGAAVAVGDLDGHRAKAEKAIDEVTGDVCLLVHGTDERPHLPFGKLADAVSKQQLVGAERGQGGGRVEGHRSLGSRGHAAVRMLSFAKVWRSRERHAR